MSPLADSFPLDFKLDLNGFWFAHMGVVLLPFVDKQWLIIAMNPLIEGLNEEEKIWNSIGKIYFYMNVNSYEKFEEKTVLTNCSSKIKIDA